MRLPRKWWARITLLLLLALGAGVQPAGAATLPFVFDMPCQAGDGLIGTYWISLPSGSPLRSAEALCAAIPTALTVRQRFPYDDGIGANPQDFTYDCLSHACTASALSPAGPEAGCSTSACFCIEPGEGFEVRIGAPTSWLVTGTEQSVTMQLVPSMPAYLASIPYETSMTNLNHVAAAFGLPMTGIMRGQVATLNPCTGALTAVAPGTAAANVTAVVPGRAYRIRYPSTAPSSVTVPTTATNDHDGDGTPDSSDPCTDPDQDGYGDPGYPATTCPIDNCLGLANPEQGDPDEDGKGNACDNCPGAFNPGQRDSDHNGAGDACDPIHDLGVTLYFDSSPSRTPCPEQPLKYCATYRNMGTLAETAAGARLAIGNTTFAVTGPPTVSDCNAVPTITQTSTATSVQLQMLWDQPGGIQPGQHCTVCLPGTVTGALGQSVPADSTIYQVFDTVTDGITSQWASANSAAQSAYISCSYDPNDKSVEPKGCGLPGMSRPGTPLKYVIRFQNLGNAPAFDVVVRDPIDLNLDLATLEILDTSHALTSVSLDASNLLTWRFIDINLPAAADDEPGSHGFVTFGAVPKAGLPDGTEIRNSAGIYFDLNPAVVTNTVINTITSNPLPGGSGSDPEICNGIDDDCDGSIDEEPEASNSCNSGDVCKEPATCVSGGCSAAPALDCSDTNLCTDDVCDFYTGCRHPDNTAPCDDANACTVGDACAAGACQPGGPRDLDGDAHADPQCGGDDCNDADGAVWSAPGEVTGLQMTADVPAAIDWTSQASSSGPGTVYDAVSGTLQSLVGVTDFASAICLPPGAPPYLDGRPEPEVGSAYWYLVRARNSCGTGTYGTPDRDTGIPPCP
jgi:uncharacterized repeat protein (TIGR01451 family)